MTIDCPPIFVPKIFGPEISGVPFLGRNDAPPDNDTTTASSDCAVRGSAISQTVTRSLSMTGFGAVCATAWRMIVKSSKMRTIEKTLDYEVYRNIRRK